MAGEPVQCKRDSGFQTPKDKTLTNNGLVPADIAGTKTTPPIKFTADNKYTINKLSDQYGQSFTSGKWSPTGKSANPFSIKYDGFLNSYPYDPHNTTIDYTMFYTRKNQNNGNTTTQSKDTSTSGQSWGDCLWREFNVGNLAGSVAISPSAENPSNVVFNFGVPVTFDFESAAKSLRNPMKVNLNYSAVYTVERSNGSAIALPSKVSDSGAFTVTGGYGASTTTKYFSTGPYAATAPPLAAGDKVCLTYIVAPAGGFMRSDGTVMVVDTPAKSFHICSPPVTNMPYAHFLGNDIRAGGGFKYNASSTCKSTGGIHTFNNALTYPTKGSYAQLGALASGNIKGLSSAGLRSTAPTSPRGLSFSNTNNITNGAFVPNGNAGGDLGDYHCVTDYYSKKNQDPNLVTKTNNSVDLASYYGGTHSVFYKPSGGALTIGSSSATVPPGTKLTIYVEGDAYINTNIIYNNWTSTSNIPSIYIISKGGNIYIDKNVTYLSGVYVAQPSDENSHNVFAGEGEIFTCATGPSVMPEDALYNNCRNQLLIKGAFIADYVFLDRAFSSLRNDSVNEFPNLNGSVKLCGDFATGQPYVSLIGDCAAEIFVSTPEMYLTQPNLPPSGGLTTGKYQYITSLSPVL